jgi:hypothetical protein
VHGHEDDRRLRSRPGRYPVPVLLVLGLVAALATSACTSDAGSDAASSGGRPETIPQPPIGNVPVAPESERVDITMPSFSNPTNITNPLFPVSQQESVLLLGHVDGKPFRTEVTLLPYTRIIQWQGLRVETLVSQYVAYLDERIQEVAYDWYAQADDGSVWYFGEDVFDFRDGAIVVTEGTWLAGKDGPAAMIMPGDPHVGDVYRTENAPGFVFEEVTITSVDETLDGPLGPIEGGMLADELHSDGKIEQKIFAPGYGEFLTGGGGDLEALALAVPTDSLPGPLPAEPTILSTGALDVFDAAGSGDWKAASATITDMAAAWEKYELDLVPRLIEPRMTRAIQALAAAVDARDAVQARNAAIEAARWSFDLQLPYRPAAEIDLARLDLWAAQLLVDAATGDPAAVNADTFALDYVRDRILHALDSRDLTRVNTELGAIQVAVVEEDIPAAADAAGRLRDILAGLEAVS